MGGNESVSTSLKYLMVLLRCHFQTCMNMHVYFQIYVYYNIICATLYDNDHISFLYVCTDVCIHVYMYMYVCMYIYVSV